MPAKRASATAGLVSATPATAATVAPPASRACLAVAFLRPIAAGSGPAPAFAGGRRVSRAWCGAPATGTRAEPVVISAAPGGATAPAVAPAQAPRGGAAARGRGGARAGATAPGRPTRACKAPRETPTGLSTRTEMAAVPIIAAALKGAATGKKVPCGRCLARTALSLRRAPARRYQLKAEILSLDLFAKVSGDTTVMWFRLTCKTAYVGLSDRF